MNVAVPQRLTFPVGPALLLALLAAVAMTARPFTPIDETRYVSVAWEMWLRGDWLVLFKNGEPYSHKPPLLFWLYNLGWLVTGVNEWWPRLVSPLFSFGSLLVMLSVGRRLWPGDGEALRGAAWILASCLLWMLFSTSGMFDVMLTFFALLGARGLLLAAEGRTRRGFAWLAFSIGFGVLAKGPVVLLHVLPLALLAPWWRPGLAWRRWYGGLLLAVLGGASIALAWAIPAAIQGGEKYARMIFWGQTAGRVADSFAHQRPFWWYLPLLPILFFPWLLWPALWRRLFALKRDGLDGGLRFCLAWLAPVLLLLSLISGKQIHYLVPLFPAFALFAGRLLSGGAPGGIWLPALIVAAAGAGMAYAALDGLPGKLEMWENLPWWPGAALPAAAALGLWLGRPPARRPVALALLGAALYAAALGFVSGNLWQRYDVRPIAEEIARLQARGVPVANNGFYHAQFHFAGRLRKPIDELLEPTEIAPWFAAHPDGVLILYVTPKPGETALFSQPYIGENTVLIDAGQARARGYLK
ncbi:MAG: Undecaprenyl phosphate-alpha-4-amino-4-deoxy-L-arabinose arabinosyl transferase [Rhodocyclaceae bacterium]|nr:Undecaprenyl phosphate-alpha-4-amino-4-deoxy-L-arabinose arabinosyl transferase [Rhodocyclaceae bacterium]